MDGQTSAGADIALHEERLEAAAGSMEMVRALLDAKVRELKMAAPEAVDTKELTALAKDLARAVGLALTEEGKVIDARRIERGGDGLDLRAAGDEVRRRLARLRERGGA